MILKIVLWYSSAVEEKPSLKITRINSTYFDTVSYQRTHFGMPQIIEFVMGASSDNIVFGCCPEHHEQAPHDNFETARQDGTLVELA